jgi:hypothetical protein
VPADNPNHGDHEGFAFFVTTLDLGLGEFADERLMDELLLLSQDATMFVMSRTAQVLHFCGEMNPARQLEVATNLFNRRGVRRVRAAFACDRTCFVSYEGATRLALLALLHSPRGPRIPDGQMADRIGSLIPVVHHKMFTHPALEDANNVHSTAFAREARLQLFLTGNAAPSGSPLPTLGQALKLGALVGAGVKVKRSIDDELRGALGVSLRELSAVAHMIAACFSAIPKEGEALPLEYNDVQVLNATAGVPKVVQDVIVGLAVKRPENVENALAVLRSPRTAWPANVSWRPFYVTTEAGQDAALCWDIRSLHNMLSWGFAEFVRPFVQQNTFGGVDDAWNVALEDVIQSAVSSALPTFQRPGTLGQVAGVPGKEADWIAMSGDDGFVVEFKNGVVRPATFRNPSPDYFETWLQQRYIKPDGLRQAYVTIPEGLRRWAKDLRRKGGQLQQDLADRRRADEPSPVSPVARLHRG